MTEEERLQAFLNALLAAFEKKARTYYGNAAELPQQQFRLAEIKEKLTAITFLDGSTIHAAEGHTCPEGQKCVNDACIDDPNFPQAGWFLPPMPPDKWE